MPWLVGPGRPYPATEVRDALHDTLRESPGESVRDARGDSVGDAAGAGAGGVVVGTVAWDPRTAAVFARGVPPRFGWERSALLRAAAGAVAAVFAADHRSYPGWVSPRRRVWSRGVA